MEWMEIEGFPGYSVSNYGRVRNDNTGRILALTRTQRGVIQVGLVLDGIQYKRGVALLVAKAFLPPPKPETFDTPIHLDGDLSNNYIGNLMWRPRWFAIRYQRQFSNDRRGFDQPIMDMGTGEWFPNSWAAAIKYGLLDREILHATLRRTYVFPTYQKFKVVKE
jgi:hypothetical protein